MNFKMIHNNLNVSNLDKSLNFYDKALELKEISRITQDDFIIVYLSDNSSSHLLELTWLKQHPQKYNLGENEIHLAFETDNFDEALRKHKQMNCVCFENPEMGLYFISDPDGYWVEILPSQQ